MGNRELRSLLVLGATSVLRKMKGTDKAPKWLSALLTRRPYKVVAVALANRIARIIWVLLTRGGTYRGLEAAKSAASACAESNPNELTGAVAGRGEVHETDDDPMGRNPDAGQAL